MSLRMLQLSDVHLGAPLAWLGDRAAARRDEIATTFRTAIEYALEPRNAIDCVVVAGDLFDSRRPDHDSLALVRGLFMRLSANGRTVIVLPGFHDGLGLHDGVFRTERLPGIDVFGASTGTISREIGGDVVHFHGAPHIPGQSPVSFGGFTRGTEAGIHVGVLHAALDGNDETEARPSAWSVSEATLRSSGLDYVALGGPHGATEIRTDATCAAAAGSLEGLDFRAGELGRKGFLVVTIADGAVRTETVPASRRTLIDLRLDLDRERIRDAEALRDALLARSGPEVFARVTLTGNREFLCDNDALLATLEDRFGWVAIVDEASFEHSSLLRRIGAESTIRGFFVRRMQRRLEGIRDRLRTQPEDVGIARELAVANQALTLGLEQFLDEDALAKAPSDRPAPADAAGSLARAGGASGTSAPGGGPGTARPPIIENEEDVADDREVELEEES